MRDVSYFIFHGTIGSWLYRLDVADVFRAFDNRRDDFDSWYRFSSMRVSR